MQRKLLGRMPSHHSDVKPKRRGGGGEQRRRGVEQIFCGFDLEFNLEFTLDVAILARQC